ncbi:MAG: efflux transporter outer membrane subunit [Deltaproteobacteria bacterium]|nr:efflux transporter outer membrane subunit [Deltaproteobacteria bacterium]
MLLAGCMKVGPDFKKPDMDSQVRGSYQHAPSDVEMEKITDRWWLAFNDSELDQIVKNVLSNNLDIKKAMAVISEMRAYFVQSRADRLPNLQLQGTAGRKRILPGIESDLYNLSLPASFEIDLWGRLGRAEEAALASLTKTEENARIIAQTIVSETITLYFQIESLERRIQIIEQSIENYRRNLSFVERRYEGGLTSILDLRQARRILAQTESTLPSLRQELGIRQQKLAVLSGQYPETRSARTQPEDYFKLPSPIPPGLPSGLLLRRPDIRAAEANLRALNAKIGVAKANRFPKITLTGNFGYSSGELDRLFIPGSSLWNIAFGVLQPIFDAGRLKAGQRAAEAQFQQGLADYARTVLTAFSEVESALLTREEQLEKRKKMLTFLAEARATQRVAENRYDRGLVGYLTVLDSQQARFQAEENLVLVELAILSNRVTLHRALGGGWGGPE